MTKFAPRTLLAATSLSLALPFSAFANTPEPTLVNAQNFARAETDAYMKRHVEMGALGQLIHLREPTPVDAQEVIRMNRDTLYSAAVFDLTEPVTIVTPDTDGRFQSLHVVNQDHFVVGIEHEAGSYTFTKEEVGTRYIFVTFRTFVDPNDPTDIAAANAAQDAIEIHQAAPGAFEAPNWDVASYDLTKQQLLDLASGVTGDVSGAFGFEGDVDPILHLLATASGWGGNPAEAAIYVSEYPEQNDGATPHALTVRDVPVEAFWSVTIYDADGFMVPNPNDAYSVNNVTATPNADGSFTVNMGGCEDGRVNCLPIMEGWNYVVRLYQPGPEILDGSWTFPKAEVVGS